MARQLRRLHGDHTLRNSSLEYWRKQSNESIIRSLTSGGEEHLTIRPDGTVLQGNHRVKVLEERGYDTSNLLRLARIRRRISLDQLFG